MEFCTAIITIQVQKVKQTGTKNVFNAKKLCINMLLHLKRFMAHLKPYAKKLANGMQKVGHPWYGQRVKQ